MVLQDLIEQLKVFPDDYSIDLGYPHSYRGYYDRLAVEPGRTNTVGNFREELEDVLGNELEGYKGGQFLMKKNTPVYVAEWGDTGLALGGLTVTSAYKRVGYITYDVEEYNF